MSIYEIKKIRSAWYVLRNGEAFAAFSSKKVAEAAMKQYIEFEKEKI